MLDEYFSQQTDDHINQFGDKESIFFLTNEEHDRCTQHSNDKLEDEYQIGYQNTMVDFQRQMNLRNRAIQILNLPKKNITDQDSTNKSHITIVDEDKNDKEKSQNVVRRENLK